MTDLKRVPVPLIEHKLTPETIHHRLQAAEARCDQALAVLAVIPDASRTFANTVEAY